MNKKIKVWQLADDLSVVSMPKRDWIIRWRDETPTPLGIGPRHERKGKCLFCWMPNGERRFFAECATVQEAKARLWKIWEMEAEENPNRPFVYATEEQAAEVSRELKLCNQE